MFLRLYHQYKFYCVDDFYWSNILPPSFTWDFGVYFTTLNVDWNVLVSTTGMCITPTHSLIVRTQWILHITIFCSSCLFIKCFVLFKVQDSDIKLLLLEKNKLKNPANCDIVAGEFWALLEISNIQILINWYIAQTSS